MPCVMPPWIWPCTIIGLIARPTIVDRAVAHDLDRAGLGIDLDLADVAAIGKAGEVDGLVAARRRAGRADRPAGRCAARRRAATSKMPMARSVPLTRKWPAANSRSAAAASSRWPAMRSPLAMMIVRGVQHDDAGEPQRAAGMRAAADRDAVGVAGHEAHAVDRHAEPFGDELREAGLVSLALRHGADDDFDLRCLPAAR